MSNFHSFFVDGGGLTVLFSLFVMSWHAYRRMMKRMDRDEDLKQDFPPHSHLPGGLIKYPKEYQPSELGRLNGAD